MSNDQAQNLRELVKNEEKCKTIFFMSGKEQVGQTVTLINIASLLSDNEYKTLILDGGSGFLRTDIMLSVFPKYGIKNAVNNDQPIDDLIVRVNDNLEIIYIRTLIEEIESSKEILSKLGKQLENLKQVYDFILIDLDEVNIKSIKDLIKDNDKILFTLNTNDKVCLKNTYSMIKDIEYHTNIRKINIIINKVIDEILAENLYKRLKTVSDKFLDIKIVNTGYISDDEKVVESLKRQVPIANSFKDSKVYSELKEIFSQLILD